MTLSGLLLWGLLSLPLLFIISVFFRLRQNAEYFRKQGIPYFGAGFYQIVKFMFMGNADIVQVEEQMYKGAIETKSPLIGISDFVGKKNIFVTDIDVIRSIYVKDFDNFVNRRHIGTQKSNRYFSKMLFSLESEPWKGMRAKLSPCFTTGKIKRMFEIFKKSSERMDAYLKEQLDPRKKSGDIDFLQIFPKYAMDVIASCAFGVDSQSFEVKPGKMSTFEQMGSQFGFRFSTKGFLKFGLVMGAPKIADMFGIDAMDWESQNYFSTVVKDVMRRRRETGERRDDFLQLMMDAQEGLLKADDESSQVLNGMVDVGGHEGSKGSQVLANDTGKLPFDDDAIIGNGLQFLMAGFDPTQSALIFTVYCLALELEIQEKLYQEIKSVMDKNGGQLTYDGINEMKYLDLVLNESMRCYPPATRTERACSKDFHVPGTNFVIEKGTIVLLPIHGIHQDPNYFPDPKRFDPERHTPENKAARHPYAFMPFGHGPRNCIGMRFALVKVKAALAQLVFSFQFAPCSKTKIPMEFGRNPNVKPREDLWLNVTTRDN